MSRIVLLLLALPGLAVAAEPAEGTVDNTNEVTWSGGPFALSNPVGCLSDTDPTCDHFIVRVGSNGVKRVLVAIAPDAGFDGDDYDLFVYDDQGVLVNSSASETGNESVVFEHTGSTFYEVRVQPWLVTPGSTYSGVAMKTREQAFDVATEECLQPVPSSLGIAGITDMGQDVDLSVLVLLDGTDQAWAEQVMARAADAYAPLGVTLTAAGYRDVAFTSVTSEDLIGETKAEVGGTTPNGVDIVCAFTAKEMQAATAGGGTVVGQADCIGGIRFDERSFCVVSDIQDIEDPQTGETGTLNSLGFNPNTDATAEVMAHEIGHLMGGHHHYANCAEGSLTSAGPNDLSPCTLMFNAVNFAGIDFGTLNGVVVRGHSVDHAD